MINFNDSTEEEGQWFQIEEGTDECGAFKLRAVSIAQSEIIDRITIRTKKKVKRGVAYDEVKTDERLAGKMRWDFIIMDWKNVAIEGKKAECNAANKVIVSKNDSFVKWAIPILEEFNESNIAVEEAKLKNSEKSSDSTN